MSEENIIDTQSVDDAGSNGSAGNVGAGTPAAPTPEQALNTLAAAARQARLTYEEHAAVDGCARVLAELVQGSQA